MLHMWHNGPSTPTGGMYAYGAALMRFCILLALITFSARTVLVLLFAPLVPSAYQPLTCVTYSAVVDRLS